MTPLRFYKILAEAAAASCLTWASAASANEGLSTRQWLPAGALAFSVGESVEVNGVPMRLSGFMSTKPMDVVAQELRREVRGHLSDDRIGARRVLGQVVGDYFVTVQLERTQRGGTRGLWAALPLRSALTHDAARHERDMLQGFPAGTRLRQSKQAVDGLRHSRTVVAHHTAGPEWLAGHLQTSLEAEGLRLERRHQEPGRGEVLMLRADGRNAMAVLSRDSDGGTVVVLTTEARLEQRP